LPDLQSFNLFSEVTTRSAPCLEFIRIENWNIAIDAIASLPVHLFNDQTPQLRHVYLSQVQSPWSLSLLRNLHSLTIHATGCRDESSSLHQVLDVLEQMPALRRLVLSYYSIPKYTGERISAVTNPRRVALRSLSQLVITGSANDVPYFMSHLDLPKGVISHFDLSECDDFNEEFRDALIAFVLKIYENLNVDPRPRGLRIVMQGYEITFEVIFGRPSTQSMVSSDYCPCIIQFEDRITHIWYAMRNAIPLLDLRFLSIDCNKPEDFSWASLIPSLRNLEYVEIQFHSTAKSFIAALNTAGTPEEAGPHRYDHDANAIPLPSLYSLSLYSIEYDDDSLLDELIDLLTMHDKRGYRLPVLRIREPWVWRSKKVLLPDRWVAKLSPLVDELVDMRERRSLPD